MIAGPQVMRLETKNVQAMGFHLLEPLSNTEPRDTLSSRQAWRYVPNSAESTNPLPSTATRKRGTAIAAIRISRSEENRGSCSMLKPSPDWFSLVRKLGSKPRAARLVNSTIRARVTMDCSITLTAVVSMDGTIIAGCLLHVQ